MGAIEGIDHGIKRFVFSLFWLFIDPLEKERVFGELTDRLERNLDTTNPDQVMAPDNFEVQVNNTVFIRHAHAIESLETVLQQRLQRLIADKDYEIRQPRVKLQILSSATLPKRKIDIRCWFSAADKNGDDEVAAAGCALEVVDGEGKGLKWSLKPGTTYKIGRHSSCDICLPFHNISKHHATLYFVSREAIDIVDEGSANGAFIDDEADRITGSRRLSLGSSIKFCKRDAITLTLSG